MVPACLGIFVGIQQAAASASTPSRSRKWLTNLAAGSLISVVALWWVFHSIETQNLAAAFQSVDLRLIACAVVATIASYFLRAYRWPYFFKERSLSLGDSWRCLIVGFFMNNTLPARLGEFVRAHLGGKASRLSRIKVLATIAAERLADGVAISLLFGLLLSFFARAHEVEESHGLTLVAYGFIGIALITALVIYQRNLAYRVLERLSSRFSGKVSKYSLSRVAYFIEGLEPLLHLRSFLILSALSAVIWSVELSVYFFVSQAFHQDLSLGAMGLFLAAVNFSSLIPAAPGGIGTIEAVTTMALVHIGIDGELALAMVVTQHIIQWLVVGIPGAFYFVVKMGGHIPEPAENDLEPKEAAS